MYSPGTELRLLLCMGVSDRLDAGFRGKANNYTTALFSGLAPFMERKPERNLQGDSGGSRKAWIMSIKRRILKIKNKEGVEGS